MRSSHTTPIKTPHEQSHTHTLSLSQTHHSHSNTQPGAYSPLTLPTSQHRVPSPDLHGRCGGCQNSISQFLSLAWRGFDIPHFVPRESELAFPSMLAHVSTSLGGIAALAHLPLTLANITPHRQPHTQVGHSSSKNNNSAQETTGKQQVRSELIIHSFLHCPAPHTLPSLPPPATASHVPPRCWVWICGRVMLHPTA